MIVTTTAVAFTSLAVGLGICGFLFLRAFSKGNDSEKKSKIGKLLSLFFIGFAAPNAILGLASFFFATQPSNIYYALVLSYVLLTALGALGIYTAYYIFYPKQSPAYMIMSMLILGISTTVTAIITHPVPFLTSSNTINWNVHPPLSILFFLLLFCSVGSAFYIFTRLFLISKNTEIKSLAFVVALLALAGMIQAFVQYILFDSTVSAMPFVQETITGAMGITFVILLGLVPAFKKFWISKEE